jgi:uncharacterized protein (DUF486 family)
MPKRTSSTPQQLKFGEPPLRGFIIHLIVFVAVIVGLAALNLTRNPSHPWFLWVLIAWGIALALHDVLPARKVSAKRDNTRSAKHARQDLNWRKA